MYTHITYFHRELFYKYKSCTAQHNFKLFLGLVIPGVILNYNISYFLKFLWPIDFTLIVFEHLLSVQFSSVAQSCPILCDPMNHSTPGLPVHHHLPEFTQTHVHRVSDAIQPSHPLSSPSPPAPTPSQHQSLFQ